MSPDPRIAIVEQTLRSHGMILPSDAVLTAVSGGPDSVALLHILHSLAPSLSIRLGVAHLNHQLRGAESERDAYFVESLAKKLDLPYHGGNMDVSEYRRSQKLSPEEAGRLLRYSFFDTIAKQYGYNRIATAHHADDNAELVLMHLIRGSGPAGFSGIPPVREGRIIRPLIRLYRFDIMEYMKQNRLDYVTDASNQELKYLRNRIRHRLIPELSKAYNPSIRKHLNRFAEIIRDEDQFMEGIIDEWFEKAADPTEKGGTALQIDSLKSHHRAIIRRILRRAIEKTKGDLRKITFDHIGASMQLLPQTSVGKHLDLPDGIGIVRTKDHLLFIKGKPERIDFQYAVDFDFVQSHGRLCIPEAGAEMQFSIIEPSAVPSYETIDHNMAFFDLEKIRFPLLIRNPKPGDRFTPFGMEGSQKVKKYFIDHKIDRPDRVRCPLLLSASGHILWIAGHRRSREARLCPHTRKIIKTQLLLA